MKPGMGCGAGADPPSRSRCPALVTIVATLLRMADPAAAADTGRLPGEDLQDPIPIPAFPWTAEGSSCGYRNDYEAPCRGAFGSPDVVYAFVPEGDLCVDVGLCGSGYNTVLHLYEGSLATPVGCNDNWCATQSLVPGLHVTAGRTYYVVVDGSAGTCGDYRLTLEACRACAPDCPPGARSEGEPDCYDGYVDRYNGGCSSDPPTSQLLPCSAVPLEVCGTYGNDLHYDQDLYRIELARPATLQVCVRAAGSPQLVVLGRTCHEILCDDGANPCGSICCQLSLQTGTYHVLVRPALTKQVVPCGSPYVLELRGYACPLAVQPSAWQGVKSRYR